MSVGARVDPYRNFNFLVEIDGITQAGFSDVTGFDITVEPIEYREGGQVTSARKIPGMAKYGNITLKRGITDSAELYEWLRQVATGVIERRNGSIILLDLEGQEKLRWNFFEAWPTKWDGPDFSAKGNEVAIETLELVVERVERA
ncbi:MAG: phage tail protein [Thermomicrobiales bacterium]